MKNVTICIKTFERPQCLESCVASIRKFYPATPVIIADDSWNPYAKDHADDTTKALILPANAGLSAGRNRMVEAAETELVAIVDDDFVFTTDTKLERLVAVCVRMGADIAAGSVRTNGTIRHYEGDLTIHNERLHMLRRPASEPTRMDVVYNFFVARRDALLDAPWDERYKMAEHAPFFWDFKLAGKVVYYNPAVVVDHIQKRATKRYNKTRVAHLDEYERLFADRFPRGIWMAENGHDAQAEIQTARRSIRNEVTGICTTVGRPELLANMVKSWQNHIGAPLIIVDQSRDQYAQKWHRGNITVIPAAYDIGGCQGYQLALEAVTTSYYALMEDDFLLTGDSDLFLLAAIVSMTPYDLIAGELTRMLPDGDRFKQEYRGTFYWPKPTHLDVRWVEWTDPRHVGKMDIVQNFYVADTRAVRDDMGGWDMELKLCDHLGFYLRMAEAGKVVGFLPAVKALHDKQTPSPREYRELRKTRQDYYRQKFLNRRGLDLVTGAEKMRRR